ncbi:MAG: sulfate ABC transporter substrate-binding protein [Victivallales bacterium]|nr:sulfate ABC transporter substrate-binding protein [Victivallales bacterium]
MSTIIVCLIALCALCWSADLLNVSYDPTRELYKEFNQAFVKHWAQLGKGTIRIDQSHGGSGKQARAVIDGLAADVVTLALGHDIDAIAEHSKLIPPDWEKRLPNNSCPYTSTIVFLVRKGNPKGIRDWDDLIRPGVKVITPNPKTSGGACWNYLAAFEWGRRKDGGDAGGESFVRELFKHVPVLDSGARGATLTFTRRNLGDVLLAWENEAFLSLKENPQKGFEIVYPSMSILAEPTVALVDKNADKKGIREIAEAYLNYLYSAEGQTIAARNFYRPSRPDLVPAADRERFKDIELINIRDAFGGWKNAFKQHFSDGGTYDRIMK